MTSGGSGSFSRPPQVPRVLFSARAETLIENPYISLLESNIRGRGVHVSRFSWTRALFGTYDVLHIHWPEALLTGRSPGRAALKLLLTSLLLIRLIIQRVPVVRTVHNIVPHEKIYGFVGARLAGALDERTDSWIHMTSYSRDNLGGKQATVIPHGSYVDWFAEYPGSEYSAAGLPRLLHFGQIRPYKGVEELLEAFREMSGAALLDIAGKPLDARYAEELKAKAVGVDGVDLNLEFIPDDQLWSLLARCTMVVLPFRAVWNSGSILLALSARCPVLTTDSPMARELQAEFGEQWVRRFQGPLSAHDLLDAVKWAQRIRSQTHGPSFAARQWEDIAEHHVRLYRSLLDRKADSLHPRHGT